MTRESISACRCARTHFPFSLLSISRGRDLFSLLCLARAILSLLCMPLFMS